MTFPFPDDYAPTQAAEVIVDGKFIDGKFIDGKFIDGKLVRGNHYTAEEWCEKMRADQADRIEAKLDAIIAHLGIVIPAKVDEAG